MKTGSASKPNALFQVFHNVKQSCCQWKYWKYISFLILLSSLCLGYYMYLVKLYLLDNTYDLRGPKELELKEKVTIRVYEPMSIKDLNQFILHYSICPSVHEIQVIWHSIQKEAPQHDAFKYTTTHSKVSFHKLSDYNTAFETFFASPPPGTTPSTSSSGQPQSSINSQIQTDGKSLITSLTTTLFD